jgi:hypothetical protein
METVELTWGNVLKIWWAWTWRTVLGGMAIGFFVGLLAGIIAIALGYDAADVTAPIAVVNFLIGMGWSVYCFRWVLSLPYANFRVALISKNIRRAIDETPPSEAELV